MLLHITHGTAVVPLMRQAAVVGRIVPWNDVLHEGPVPAGLNEAALREVRAAFLVNFAASERALTRADIERELAERDAAISEWRGVDEVVLWFEHDLYDQLQLLQVLDRLPVDRTPLVSAVPDDEYLGSLDANRFAELLVARRPVTSAQRVAAHDAFEAFRAADPRPLLDALPRVSDLRHLAAALTRHLQQFPSVENGLSRTEQQALEAIAEGVTLVSELYVTSHHGREEAIFMGDTAFLFHLAALTHGPRPLIRLGTQDHDTSRPVGHLGGRLTLNAHVGLTTDGEHVLRGRADRVRTSGIDRWLGGVHVSGHGPVWRWDADRSVVRQL